MKDTVIFFDCFGVILNNISVIWHSQYNENIQKECLKLYRLVDQGIISTDTLMTMLSVLTDEDEESILSFWNNEVKLDESLYEYIKSIKDKYLIVLLSNASSEYIRPLLNRFNLYSIFDDFIISSEVGVAKPDKEIFILAKEKYKDKKNYIFVDDNIKNIEVSNSCGIRGIIYTNKEELEKELETSI